MRRMCSADRAGTSKHWKKRCLGENRGDVEKNILLGGISARGKQDIIYEKPFSIPPAPCAFGEQFAVSVEMGNGVAL